MRGRTLALSFILAAGGVATVTWHAAHAQSAAPKPIPTLSPFVSPVTAPAIRHGIELDSTMVGPAAAGLRVDMEHPGGVIRDGVDYPFARRVAEPARYNGFEVAGPHLLIEGVHFTGSLDISATIPIVLRGAIVRPQTRNHWAILTRAGAGPLLVLWSQVGGAAGPVHGTPADTRHAVGAALLLTAPDAVVYRSHLSLSIDGIRPSGSRLRVIETVIDQLTEYPDAHIDGIQIMGAVSDIAILRNRIVNANPQTSAITLVGKALRIDSNYLAGGGWTLYGGARGDLHGGTPTSHSRVTDTIFGTTLHPKSGTFGAAADWNFKPEAANVWSGNRLDTGAAVEP